MESIEEKLIEAVFDKQLPQTCRQLLEDESSSLAPHEQALVERAWATCLRIGEELTDTKEAMLKKLEQAGAQIPEGKNGESIVFRLFHTFEIELRPADLDLSIPVLQAENFLFWNPTSGGGWELFKRLNGAMEVIRTDEETTRMIIRWRTDPERNRLARLLLPSTLDMQSASLPKPLWPLYFLYRPVRIAADFFKQEKKAPILGPYLGTPSSLIHPILELVEVTDDDVLVDIGCGDGRIAIEAAESIGCRTIGVEINDQLIAIAQENVRAKGLESLVKIMHNDASDFSLEEASVVFVFLPVQTVNELIPQFRKRLRKGTRIVTHEQAKPRFVGKNKPDLSKLILADQAVTVAHVWQV